MPSWSLVTKSDDNSFKLSQNICFPGYGREDGEEYWIIKNSWGKSWGEGGYLRLTKNFHNHCGVATFATYPIV